MQATVAATFDYRMILVIKDAGSWTEGWGAGPFYVDQARHRK